MGIYRVVVIVIGQHKGGSKMVMPYIKNLFWVYLKAKIACVCLYGVS